MTLKPATVFLFTALTASMSLAQITAPAIRQDFKPSVLNQPGQEYPQVNSQGHAVLRLWQIWPHGTIF
jgi:hypothetical protein